MKNQIGVLSLGCPRNLVDTEIITSLLKDRGYKITEIDKKPEVALVNTCAFIKEAEEESLEIIEELISLKKQGLLKRIIVYGCLVERYKYKLLPQLKEVDALVGRISLNHAPMRKCFLSPKHFTYLKVCEGCLNHCSYCVIPKIKPNFESRSLEDIIEEVRFLEKRGVKELNIVGQDITLFGKDLGGGLNLVVLLKEILKNTHNIRWIRLLYLYPHHISDELLELIEEEERICKYIDLPIQHINARILKLMNRNTPPQYIYELIRRVREKIPSVFIRTTLMVGFPTETEVEFRQLVDFVREFRFERLGVFMYSKEIPTPAARIKPQVPLSIKRKRFAEIMQVQQEISSRINERFLGKTIEVLIDEKQNGHYLGRSMYDAPEVDGSVWVNSKRPLRIGSFVKAKIIDTLDYDLIGEAL